MSAPLIPDRRLWYRVTDSFGGIIALWRWYSDAGKWKSVIGSGTPCSDCELKLLMDIINTQREIFVMPFACCCFECATPEAKKFWAEQHAAGVMISHGYWPECAVKMRQNYEQELANLTERRFKV